jgi:hypothetical protein
MSLATYDPAQHSISFGGNILTGFASDSLVEIEQDNDTFTYTTSADGPGARARVRDESVTIRVRLLKTSMSNDILSALWEADKLRGVGIREFVVKDLAGANTFSGDAWIQKPPTMAVGAEIDNYEWTLRCAKPAAFHIGGIPS